MKKKQLLFAALVAVATSTGLTACSSDSDDNANNSGGNQIDETNVVNNDASALSLVNGVYSHWQPLSSSFSFII